MRLLVERIVESFLQCTAARVAGAALSTLALTSISGAQLPRSDSLWLAQLSRKFPCRATTVAVAPVQGPISRYACTLVTASLNEIVRGRTEALRVVPSDTANVRKAAVSTMTFQSLDNEPSEAYWLVTLIIAHRDVPLNVRFDRRTHAVTVSDGENWGQSE